MIDLIRTNLESIPDGFDSQIAALERDGAIRLKETPQKFSKDIICIIPDLKVKYFENRETFRDFRNRTLQNPKIWGGIIWMEYPNLNK